MSSINFVALCESVLKELQPLLESVQFLTEASSHKLKDIAARAITARKKYSEAQTKDEKEAQIKELKSLQLQLLRELRGTVQNTEHQDHLRTVEEFDELIEGLAISIGTQLEGLMNLKYSMIANEELGLVSDSKTTGYWLNLFKKPSFIQRIKNSLTRTLLGRNI